MADRQCFCVATNGSGAGWKGEFLSGGSLNNRGVGYTSLDKTSRGYITNQNSFIVGLGMHYYNGTTDYVANAPGGTIAANALTYLGSFYTTVAGQTSFAPAPAPAAPGPQASVGICNAYNQVPVSVVTQDTHAAYPIYGLTGPSTWEVADRINNGINNILVLDCLRTNPWNAQLSQPITGVGATIRNSQSVYSH